MRLPVPRLLSTRLALIAGIGVAVAVAVFAVAGYLLVRDGAFDEIDRSLQVTADEVALASSRSDAGVRDFTAPPTKGTGAAAPRVPAGNGPATTIVQRFEAGSPLGPARIAGTATEARPLQDLPGGPPRTVAIGGERFRVVARALPASPDGKSRTVVVARSVEDVEATLEQAATRLGLGAAAAAGLALVVALFAARRGLRRLVRVRDAAERVAASDDLTVRIPEDRADEVGGLAAAMNRMLSRLQTTRGRLAGALEEQRRFAADASHELRTPLTALQGDIDLLRRAELPPEEREQVLDEMATAAGRMARMVEDLLVLARTEGDAPGRRTAVDLGELLLTLAAPGEEVSLPEERAAIVSADPAAMEALFRNLLRNARRHGRTVEVAVRVEGAEAAVQVADDGPGVAPQDRERIFDRFYRSPELRSTPGTGLGLPIARMAAEQAGGSVRLLDSEVGARFEVRLPLVGGAAPVAGHARV